MAQSLDDLTQAVLSAAQKAGATAADAIAVEGTSVTIDVRNGALEQAERSEGVDLGLRVFVGQRQACVAVSDTSPGTLITMAERAVAMATESPEDPFIGLADQSQLSAIRDASGLELHDDAPEPAPAELQDEARRAEASAMAVDGVAQVQSASAGYGARRIHIAASNGFSGGYARSDRYISCVAISGTGGEMERDYDSDGRVFASDLRSPEEIGQRAAERAVSLQGAVQPPTGAFPVLYDERVSSTLISHILGAVNGASIARGSSWLRDALGEQILPKGMDLIEDPNRPRVPGTRHFDAEGLPTARRKIVEDGVLTGWTLDLAHARKLDMLSTASAARGTASPPSPSNWNIALTQGTQSRDALIAEMGTGLLVTSMIGSTINPNTGDYSRGASGFWIENGEIAYPVNQCTIAGNLRQMLLTLTPANDARTHLSRVVPSLRVEGMTLAGQ